MKALKCLRVACLLGGGSLTTVLSALVTQVALAGEPVTLPPIGSSGYADPRSIYPPTQPAVQRPNTPIPSSATAGTPYTFTGDGWVSKNGTPIKDSSSGSPTNQPVTPGSAFTFTGDGWVTRDGTPIRNVSAGGTTSAHPTAGQPVPLPASVHTPNAAISSTEKLLPIDLPYALKLVDAANPTIALARERISQAYAELKQAQVIWVPSIFLGGNPHAFAFLPMYYTHSGVVQNAQGLVTQTTKSNFFAQAGATLEVSVADALFGPRIARHGMAAIAARAKAVQNEIQLDVALAYLDLLQAYGELAIDGEALAKAETMYKAAESAFKEGLGKTGADPDRARAEVRVLTQRRFVDQAAAARASATLAQLLMLESGCDLLPSDQTVLPIELISPAGSIDDLIAVALMNRPELAETRALIAAALTRWNQAKYRPLLPTLQAFYYGGNFIGGKTEPDTAGGRSDFLGQMSWELKNLGLGDLYNAKMRRSQYNQANLQAMEVQTRIGAEVATAVKIVRQRQKAIADAQIAVRSAEEMWTKLEKVAFGVGLPARQFDPLGPLLAERALREARLLYLEHVIEYNRNQFRLYWSLGQPPACALPQARTQVVEVSVLPTPNAGPVRRNPDSGGGAADSKDAAPPAPPKLP